MSMIYILDIMLQNPLRIMQEIWGHDIALQHIRKMLSVFTSVSANSKICSIISCFVSKKLLTTSSVDFLYW